MENNKTYKSLSFYYKGLKENLLKLSAIEDNTLDLNLEIVFNKIDSLTIENDFDQIIKIITPVYRALSDENFLKRRNIFDPNIKKVVADSVMQLEIYISMVNAEKREFERTSKNELTEVKERLHSQPPLIKNGVDEMYNRKNTKKRLPNIG